MDVDFGRRAAFAVVVWGVARAAAVARSERPRPPELDAFLQEFLSSFNNLDWERFRALYDREATVFFPPPYPPERATGRAAIEAGFEEVFHRWKSEREGPPYLDLRPQDLLVQGYGETAVVTFHLDADEGLSRRTLVVNRNASGWKIVHLHASRR